jgi:hypothetical protein
MYWANKRKNDCRTDAGKRTKASRCEAAETKGTLKRKPRKSAKKAVKSCPKGYEKIKGYTRKGRVKTYCRKKRG